MGALARLFPGPAFLSKIVIYVLVFSLGGALGNGWATQRALEEREREGAKRMVEYHGQIVTYYADELKKLRLAREQQEGADKAAYKVLEDGKAEAERAAQRARQALAAARGEIEKGKQLHDDLKAVNQMLAAELRPNDPGCVLSPGVRRTLDIASGAVDDPDSGDSQTDSSGVPDGSGASGSSLACEQLARGYVELARHDRMLQAWVRSWQSWAAEALR